MTYVTVNLLRRLGGRGLRFATATRVSFDTTVANIHDMEREGYTVMRSH